MDWAQGYVSDSQYTAGFYREMTTPFLTMAGLINGVRVPPQDTRFNYCELGCGQGVGTNLMAAASPHGRFVGIDFNPGQIDNARRLALSAGLTNVDFIEASFSDLLHRQWPEFDYISLHGIYSWISLENRGAICRFIDRTLKPGGLVYVSYNTMPGWAGMAPAQRLMREVAKRRPGRSDSQALAGLEMLELLNSGGARYFGANPSVSSRVTKARSLDRTYLAHEYLNSNWHPLYVTDVMAEMAEAKLSYLGSATLVENLDNIFLPANLRQAISAYSDTDFVELLKDFNSNKQFRRDIYVRGQNRLTAVEIETQKRQLKFTLAVPFDSIKFAFDTIVGEAKGNQDLYARVVDALKDGPKDFASIVADCAGLVSPQDVFQALYLLFYSNQIASNVQLTCDSSKNAQSFNKAIFNELRQGRILPFLAVPGSGSGMAISLPHLFILCALDEGLTDEKAISRRLIQLLGAYNVKLAKDGNPITEPAEVENEAVGHVDDALRRHVIVWRGLGIMASPVNN